MNRQIEVGILGATGVVGQQFVSRLAGHPWFNVTWLAASERSEGRKYRLAAPWRLAAPMPDAAAAMTVNACVPGKGPRVVFSALDAAAAGELQAETEAANKQGQEEELLSRIESLTSQLITVKLSSMGNIEKTDFYDEVINQLEKILIAGVLKKFKGNQVKTSKFLGINRNTLRTKIEKYSIS